MTVTSGFKLEGVLVLDEDMAIRLAAIELYWVLLLSLLSWLMVVIVSGVATFIVDMNQLVVLALSFQAIMLLLNLAVRNKYRLFSHAYGSAMKSFKFFKKIHLWFYSNSFTLLFSVLIYMISFIVGLYMFNHLSILVGVMIFVMFSIYLLTPVNLMLVVTIGLDRRPNLTFH